MTLSKTKKRNSVLATRLIDCNIEMYLRQLIFISYYDNVAALTKMLNLFIFDEFFMQIIVSYNVCNRSPGYVI